MTTSRSKGSDGFEVGRHAAPDDSSDVVRRIFDHVLLVHEDVSKVVLSLAKAGEIDLLESVLASYSTGKNANENDHEADRAMSYAVLPILENANNENDGQAAADLVERWIGHFGCDTVTEMSDCLHFAFDPAQVRQLLLRGASPNIDRSHLFGSTPLGTALQRADQTTASIMMDFMKSTGVMPQLMKGGSGIFNAILTNNTGDSQANNLKLLERLSEGGIPLAWAESIGQSLLEYTEPTIGKPIFGNNGPANEKSAWLLSLARFSCSEGWNTLFNNDRMDADAMLTLVSSGSGATQFAAQIFRNMVEDGVDLDLITKKVEIKSATSELNILQAAVSSNNGPLVQVLLEIGCDPFYVVAELDSQSNTQPNESRHEGLDAYDVARVFDAGDALRLLDVWAAKKAIDRVISAAKKAMSTA